MNQKNYTSNEDFDDGVDLSDISSKLKKGKQDYINGDEEYKQNYWDSYFVRGLLPLWSIKYPVDISDFREKIKDIELNVERFLPGVIKAMEDFTGEEGVKIEDMFILDEQDKDILENIQNNSDQVKNTITTKTEKIEGINISNEELAEKIGDLFYDSLSSFISSLGGKIDNTEIAELLKEASNHIMEAWKICLPYVSHDFPEMKHTSEVKGLDIDKEELVKRNSSLVNTELSDFLEKLSQKIEKDGEADKGRGRIKLANELFACADNLKQASDLLK